MRKKRKVNLWHILGMVLVIAVIVEAVHIIKLYRSIILLQEAIAIILSVIEFMLNSTPGTLI